MPRATYVCRNADCIGFDGVSVEWGQESETGQYWLSPEECPHCIGELFEQHAAFEDVIAYAADELAIHQYAPSVRRLDERALLTVMRAELERQARAERAADEARAQEGQA